MVRLALMFLMSTLLSTLPIVAQPFERTVFVDCDEGETLTEALRTPGSELIVEFTGTCNESVVLQRDRVTLRGADGTATLVAPGVALEVTGAAPVTLEAFRITGSAVAVAALRGSAVLLSDMLLDDNLSTGLALDQGASAVVRNSTLDGNGFAGLSAFNGSKVSLEGQVRTNGNGIAGLLISTGSNLQGRTPNVVSNDNGQAGAFVQLGASALLPSFESRRNALGLAVLSAAPFNGNVEISDSFFGIVSTGNSEVVITGTVERSVNAILVGPETRIQVGGNVPSTVEGKLATSGGTVNLRNASLDEVDLSFGARMLVGPNVTIGQLVCNETALVAGGGFTCPSSADSFEGGTDSFAPSGPTTVDLEPLPNPLD